VNLINASVNYGVRCFVFTSSIAVYGAGQSPMTEQMLPLPEDSYGIAKVAVENELKVTHEIFGLDYVIFRPHNVYGERQNIGDRYRNVVGIFMNQLMKASHDHLWGRPTAACFHPYQRCGADYRCLVDVPSARNHIFNVGADVLTR